MARVYNSVETAVEISQIVNVELTDEQILKAAAEIWIEDPTKCMGQLIAYASDPAFTPVVDDGLHLR